MCAHDTNSNDSKGIYYTTRHDAGDYSPIEGAYLPIKRRGEY